MISVSVIGCTYDSNFNNLALTVDFSALGEGMPTLLVLAPEAIGNRIVRYELADGGQALDAIVREHALRMSSLEPLSDDVIAQNGGTDPRIAVVWQSPADREKAQQLDAHADAIEAARVFFAPPVEAAPDPAQAGS